MPLIAQLDLGASEIIGIVGSLGAFIVWLTAIFVRQGKHAEKLDNLVTFMKDEVKPDLRHLKTLSTQHETWLNVHCDRLDGHDQDISNLRAKVS